MLKIEEVAVEGYVRVVHGVDEEAGLNAFVSVHNTNIGPGLGGIRLLAYRDERSALEDVNRLAQAMSYKNAVAETGMGGGKTAVIGDPAKKTEAQFVALGRLIDALEGIYYAAEDMNINEHDLRTVKRETQYVTGLPQAEGGSGNPSPYTAHGVMIAMRACAEEAFGVANFEDLRVAVQGIGAVGWPLAELCLKAGAEVTVADIDPERVARFVDGRPGVKVEDVEAILRTECDILAPCARGPVFDEAAVGALNCRIVCGAANNQLASPEMGDLLGARGVLYAPDYVANAGGVINLACEFDEGGYKEENSYRKLEKIGPNLKRVFEIARERKISTAAAADRLAEERIAAGTWSGPGR